MTIRRVRIKYDGKKRHADAIDVETGDSIARMRSIRFSDSVDDMPRATIEVLVDEIDVLCDAEIAPCCVPAGDTPLAFVLECPAGIIPSDEYLRRVEEALKPAGYPVVVVPQGMRLDLVCVPKESK